MKARDVRFDIAKGIGVLCVVFAHLGWDKAFRTILPFNMPLFFLISGYFLSTNKSFGSFFKKRAKVLLSAYSFTSICMVFLRILADIVKGDHSAVICDMIRMVVRALYGSGTVENLTPWGIGQIGAIWFLPALLWASTITYGVVVLIRNELAQFGTLLIVFLICCFSAKVFWMPLSLQAGGCASLFVYIGWFIKTKRSELDQENLDRMTKYSWMIALVGIFALVYESVMDISLNMVKASYPAAYTTIPFAVLTSWTVVWISKYLAFLTPARRVLSFFGRYSLCVLCFHLMELDFFPWNMVYSFCSASGMRITLQYLLVFLLKVILLGFLTWGAIRIKPLGRVFGITDERDKHERRSEKAVSNN